MNNFDILREQKPPQYIKWSFAIILKNRDRAKEIYYLLLGFSGSGNERRCSI